MADPVFRAARAGSSDTMAEAWLGTCALLRFRTDRPREEYAAYWRDVHGPIIARTAGIHSYRQHHLAGPAPTWPVTEGVETDIPADALADGIAEATLHRPLRGLFSPAGRAMRRDEPHVLTGVRQYLAARGRFSGRGPAAAGHPLDSSLSRSVTFFRCRPGVRGPLFAARFFRPVEEALRSAPGAFEARTYRFHPYRPPLLRARGIDYALPAGGAYAAALVVAAGDREEREEIVRIAASAVPAAVQRHLCSAIHSFAVARTYTLVHEGRPTAAATGAATSAETTATLRGGRDEGTAEEEDAA